MDHNNLESSTQYAVPCINKKKHQKQVNKSFFQVTQRLCFKARLTAKPLIWKWLLILMENVFTFGGAKRSGSDRECKYFPIGMNAREPLWR